MTLSVPEPKSIRNARWPKVAKPDRRHNGRIDEADYERTVHRLLFPGGIRSVHQQADPGSLTHAITDQGAYNKRYNPKG